MRLHRANRTADFQQLSLALNIRYAPLAEKINPSALTDVGQILYSSTRRKDLVRSTEGTGKILETVELLAKREWRALLVQLRIRLNREDAPSAALCSHAKMLLERMNTDNMIYASRALVLIMRRACRQSKSQMGYVDRSSRNILAGAKVLFGLMEMKQHAASGDLFALYKEQTRLKLDTDISETVAGRRTAFGPLFERIQADAILSALDAATAEKAEADSRYSLLWETRPAGNRHFGEGPLVVNGNLRTGDAFEKLNTLIAKHFFLLRAKMENRPDAIALHLNQMQQHLAGLPPEKIDAKKMRELAAIAQQMVEIAKENKEAGKAFEVAAQVAALSHLLAMRKLVESSWGDLKPFQVYCTQHVFQAETRSAKILAQDILDAPVAIKAA